MLAEGARAAQDGQAVAAAAGRALRSSAQALWRGVGGGELSVGQRNGMRLFQRAPLVSHTVKRVCSGSVSNGRYVLSTGYISMALSVLRKAAGGHAKPY